MLTKRLGVYMDHSSARLIDITSGAIETNIIGSQFTHAEKEESLGKSESVMHHKEQHEEGAYYKQLGEAIKLYDDVILFGTTQAKTELYNILRADRHFEKIRLEVKPTDRLTEPQQDAVVRAHFAKR